MFQEWNAVKRGIFARVAVKILAFGGLLDEKAGLMSLLASYKFNLRRVCGETIVCTGKYCQWILVYWLLCLRILIQIDIFGNRKSTHRISLWISFACCVNILKIIILRIQDLCIFECSKLNHEESEPRKIWALVKYWRKYSRIWMKLFFYVITEVLVQHAANISEWGHSGLDIFAKWTKIGEEFLFVANKMISVRTNIELKNDLLYKHWISLLCVPPHQEQST